MDKPILDPAVPYVGPIYGGRFSPGKAVRIQGASPGVAYRFSIYLQCGPETVQRDDVAVEVQVRFLDGYVSLNSFQNGGWGEELRGASLPIKRAESFEIIITCDFSQYKVAINGQHYCEFPQRIHYDRITHLAIDGDVSIVRITYESASSAGISSFSAGRIGAPISSAPLEAGDDGFELIDSTNHNRSPPGIRSAPSVGFTQPPSYDVAKHGVQGGSALNAPPAGTPYPMGGAPYPTGGAPYPTGGAPYPTGGAPYPTGGAPYPMSGGPYATTLSYPVAPLNAVPYSPPGAPVPLNAISSPYRPLNRSSNRRCWLISMAIVFSIICVCIAVVMRVVYGPRKINNY